MFHQIAGKVTTFFWYFKTNQAKIYIFIDKDDNHLRSKGIKSDVGNPTSLNTNELALSYPTLIKVVKGGTVAETAQGTWMHEDVLSSANIL